MKLTNGWRIACFLLVALLVTPGAFAQSITGSVVGTVVDTSEAVVPGASVTLTQQATGAERKAETSELGRFVFSSVQPGAYTLSIEAEGFKRLELSNINLTAAETLPLGNIALEVGVVTESVQVTSQGIMVQTQTAERAGVLTGSQVENLAIRGRNVLSLLSLLPGVVSVSEPEALDHGWNINVLGNRRNTTNVSLDGATLNAYGNQFNTVVNVSMDAVAEVKVLMSNYQAEYGRLSGANVHMVAKSGTRDFHGLFSYWKRHEQFNANEFFNNRLGRDKPRYRYNTWNYNIGGPVYIPGKFNTNKDKLFFFWSQEFWPLTTTSAITTRTMPTALERIGDFSQSVDVNNKLVVVKDPTTGQPFPGNVVPSARINRSGQALLNAFPEPNFFDRSVSKGNYNYVFQSEQDSPKRTETLKLDSNLTSNDIISFNYTYRTNEQKGDFGVGPGNNFPSVVVNNKNAGKAVIGRYQKIISPAMVNELNLGYSDRPWNHEVDPDTLKLVQRSHWGFDAGQFHPDNNPLDILPNATFGGIVGAASHSLMGRFPLETSHRIFTLSNNLTKTFSNHIVKAGFYADRTWGKNHGSGNTFNGAFDFARNVNNPLDTNYAYTNAVLGVYNSYTEPSTRPIPEAIVSNIEWFVQDNWRVSNRLTLDLGRRFYWLPHAFAADGRTSGFSPAAYDPANAVQLIQPTKVGGKRVGVHPVTGEIYPVTFIGAMAPGVGEPANGMISPVTDSSVPGSLMEDRGVHFGPRFGFAYDAFGNGRTAIRGGFGMFYNRMAGGMIFFPMNYQPPMVETPILYFGRMDNLLESSGVLFPTNVIGLDRQGKIPTVMNYSFSIQQDIGFGTVVDIGYVGSLGRRLLWQRNVNETPFGTNFQPENIDPTTNKPYPTTFLRPYIGYNNVNVREPGSSSNYHSLQVTANRRFAHGIEFGAAWTWSKTMDYNDTDDAGVSSLVPVRVWNYGLAGFDRTHVFKVNWLWDIPNSGFRNPVLKGIFNNWQFSGIASFISGQPLGVGYSTVSAVDITGSTHGSRIVVLDNPVLPKSERTFDRYFRTDVFALPAVGTIGNSAKNILRGPGVNNWDTALYKSFPIREAMRLQFRWELYNAFNHTQFAGVNTGARFDNQGNQVNALLGQITSARDARKMQFALRFTF